VSGFFLFGSTHRHAAAGAQLAHGPAGERRRCVEGHPPAEIPRFEALAAASVFTERYKDSKPNSQSVKHGSERRGLRAREFADANFVPLANQFPPQP
jgi:hypothetical protein